jgi:hypothetical protein
MHLTSCANYHNAVIIRPGSVRFAVACPGKETTLRVPRNGHPFLFPETLFET